MCEEMEEKISLETIISEKEREIYEKYELAEIELDYHPPRLLVYKTGIDYEIAKLMEIKRKKEFKLTFLKREIYDLDYEIHQKYDNEVSLMEFQYKVAWNMLKEDYPIDIIASSTKLTKKQIEELRQTI